MGLVTLMSYEFPKEVGDRLPNSGVIIAETVLVSDPVERESVVLCFVPGVFQTYVVWRRVVRVAKRATSGRYADDYCWSGDYFTDITDAVECYDERTNRRSK